MLSEPEILDEDGPVLLINKPGGVLTQAPPGIDSLEARIKNFLIVRDSKPGKAYLGVPHRLDRPASGVMVFAKHVRAARRIADQFQARTVEKIYWAVVHGLVTPDEGHWADWMRKIPDEPRSEICDEADDGAQRAILKYQVMDRINEQTYLKIQLETGRTHQIRLQAASRGYSILGDTMYGSVHTFGEVTADMRKRCIALHARSIRLRHPMKDQEIYQVAPVSAAWAQLKFEFKEQVDN